MFGKARRRPMPARYSCCTVVLLGRNKNSNASPSSHSLLDAPSSSVVPARCKANALSQPWAWPSHAPKPARGSRPCSCVRGPTNDILRGYRRPACAGDGPICSATALCKHAWPPRGPGVAARRIRRYGAFARGVKFACLQRVLAYGLRRRPHALRHGMQLRPVWRLQQGAARRALHINLPRHYYYFDRREHNRGASCTHSINNRAARYADAGAGCRWRTGMRRRLRGAGAHGVGRCSLTRLARARCSACHPPRRGSERGRRGRLFPAALRCFCQRACRGAPSSAAGLAGRHSSARPPCEAAAALRMAQRGARHPGRGCWRSAGSLASCRNCRRQALAPSRRPCTWPPPSPPARPLRAAHANPLLPAARRATIAARPPLGASPEQQYLVSRPAASLFVR